ncbi:MAG: cell wall-binding repeat-containing protein [Peptostreptococcus stomatis]|uniref:cell wall-binding repeat-containing protein n=1 Tax=Peptostreptococcus stomatis TaxID=341694 RepID=UPI001A46D6CE|nr:cell wall-binding repeat-containing protein [Peptostreptococcus stomatis]MBL6466132.1 cell wall-binding repeat-containing protein [Peptostreptococcus stomatis]
MRLRKKQVAIFMALGMVLTSAGPVLADQVTSPNIETVSSDTNNSEIIVSPDVLDPKLDPGSSLATFLSSDQVTMRISGPGRVETSIEISKFENTKSKTVILADARNYPDALAASNLTNGRYSVILVQNQLTQAIINEITRLGAQDLIILGGTNSISEDIEKDLANIAGVKNISRIAGETRYDTCQKIFSQAKKKSLVLASGEIFPDALATSSILDQAGLLLTKKDQLPSEAQAAIKDLNHDSFQIVGGENSIQESLATSIANQYQYASHTRISGNNRYETSAKIGERLVSSTVILASGENFPDALAASTLAQKIDSPILLVSKDKIDQSIIDYFKKHNIKKALVVGGQLSISDKTLANAERLIKGQDPIDNEGPQKPQPKPDLKPDAKPSEPKTTGKVINKVPYISQLKPVYAPNGCEATSLLMGLKGKGYTDLDLRTFLDRMPKTKSNPAKGYVGSPYGNEKSRFLTIDPEPLARYGQRYGNVVNIKGAPIEDIIKEIQEGNTVVIYVTLHWAPAYYKTLPIDGVPTRRIFNNHVLLLTGYDPVKKAFYIADPYNHESDGARRDKPFFYWKSQDLVDKCYNYGNRRFAVAIR